MFLTLIAWESFLMPTRFGKSLFTMVSCVSDIEPGEGLATRSDKCYEYFRIRSNKQTNKQTNKHPSKTVCWHEGYNFDERVLCRTWKTLKNTHLLTRVVLISEQY